MFNGTLITKQPVVKSRNVCINFRDSFVAALPLSSAIDTKKDHLALYQFVWHTYRSHSLPGYTTYVWQ